MFARGALAIAVVALCGCPGPSTMDAGVDAGLMLTVVETCDLLAAAKCDLYSRCYAAFNRDATDDCRALQQSRCLFQYDQLKSAFEENLVTIDVDRVFTCKQRMETSACPATFPPDYTSFSKHPFDDCQWTTGLLIGKKKSNDTCKLPVECAPGTICIKPGGVCEGTCSSASKDTEPCAFGCGPGLRCDDHGDIDRNNDVCAPVKELNEGCTSSGECRDDLVCNVTCRPRGKENESCWFDRERLSTCDPGLACDVVPYVTGDLGTCIKPRHTAEPCRFHWSCQPGLVCADIDWTGFPMATPSMGSCREPIDPDGDCQPTIYSVFVGDPCKAGTRCSLDTKKCTVIPKLGDQCSPSTQTCAGVNVFCKPAGGDMGNCTGPAGQGDRCAFAIDATSTVSIPCTTGFCDTESTLTCRAPFRPLNQVCKENGECTSGRCAVQQDRSLRCAMACN